MSTKIEWCQNPDGTPGETWNPVTGCSKVSAGCANCYAERMVKRLAGRFGYPENNPFAVTLQEDRLEQPLRWTKPRGVFVCSMGDLFHEDVGDLALQLVFSIMASASEHTFYVLTKRPERMRQWVRRLRWVRGVLPLELPPFRAPHLLTCVAAPQPDIDVEKAGGVPLEVDWVPSNVWLGVSVENQAAADERIPLLLDTPAAVRFVSCEPLLGRVDIRGALLAQREIHMRADVEGMLRNRSFDGLQHDDGRPMSRQEAEDALFALLREGVRFIPVGEKCEGFTPEEGCPGHPRPALDWVIAGGESGPRARPSHPDWFRGLRDQCQAAGVPYFFKQWGEWAPLYDRDVDDPDWRDVPEEGPRVRRINLAGGSGFHGERLVYLERVGKKAAGRELDGRTWDERPALEGGE